MFVLLLMAGLYGAIIALCNQYLREHDMLTKSSKFILGVIMFAGFYFIYKWFSKRIDSIQKQNDWLTARMMNIAKIPLMIWLLIATVTSIGENCHRYFLEQDAKYAMSRFGQTLCILLVASAESNYPLALTRHMSYIVEATVALKVCVFRCRFRIYQEHQDYLLQGYKCLFACKWYIICFSKY